MRKPFIAGNWKMNKDLRSARSLADALQSGLESIARVELAVFPAFVHLSAVSATLSGSNIGLGAQDTCWDAAGAYTGAVSPPMLTDVGCRYVILGHSERRTLFSETNHDVNRKLLAALEAGLTPIVCVGETPEQHQAGSTEQVVSTQIQESLASLSATQMKATVIAYEPIWAIGTGLTATPEQAQQVHHLIRSLLARIHDEKVAGAVRIQYGGSVKPANAAALMAQPDIDGALVGGASLEAESFVAIARSAC